MQLQFIGHAGFTLSHQQSLLVMDPWLSKEGAYDSAWMQFPSNHHLEPDIITEINESSAPFIYISHEHKDHFDPKFLDQINKGTTLLIPSFNSKQFLSQVRQLGFRNILELKDDQTITLGNFKITLFVDDSGINHDSGILVQTDHGSFLNLNDCKIFDRLTYIKNKYGPIDVFAVQFSGATWHPTCYVMPKEKYSKISKQKKMSKFIAVLRALQILEPKRYLPTAGPACFLDPDLYSINFEEENIFPSQQQAIDFLSQQKLHTEIDPIMPGDIYDFRTNQYSHLAESRVNKFNLESYLENYKETYAYLYQNNSPEIKEAFSKLYDALEIKLSTLKKSNAKLSSSPYHLYFTLREMMGHENIKWVMVDTKELIIKIVDCLPEKGYYEVAYPGWEIERITKNQISWEDLALTFRAKLNRNPDIYDTLTNCFLFSNAEDLVDNIRSIEKIRNNKERIKINAYGQCYEINRYCPHQGADLKYGWPDGEGNWVCPRHRWTYNLNDEGKCLTSEDSIKACTLEKV